MLRTIQVRGLLAAMLIWTTLPRPSLAASLDPATWRGDVRFLVAAVDSLHPCPYRWNRRAAWDSAATELERQLPAMRYDQAVAGFSRLLGLLRDGHSRLGQMRLIAHGRPSLAPLPGPGFADSYPIEFEVFTDGLWITRTTPAHARWLGKRVVSIHGVPVQAAIARLTPLIPADNPMWTLYVLPALLRVPGYLSAAGVSKDPAAPLVLTLTDARGSSSQATLAAEHTDSNTVWQAADAKATAPLPLTSRLPGPLAFADLGDSARAVFVRVRAIVDEPGQESFARFVERLFAHVDSIGSRRLILDLRGNGGGNNYLNQPLVHALIQRPSLNRPGRLFVIVDRGTFSAAVSLSADLERETHALFVGEPTGGAPNSPGDPARVTLPASGLLVRISTVLWNGSDPRDPRAFIAPDIPAPLTWADWIAHRDPALAAIEASRLPDSTTEVPPNTRWGNPARLNAKVPIIAW